MTGKIGHDKQKIAKFFKYLFRVTFGLRLGQLIRFLANFVQNLIG